MENKSLLFLLVGLGMLTLVVLISLIFFYPKENASLEKAKPSLGTSHSYGTSPEFDPVEWTRTLPSMDFIPLSADSSKESKNDDLVTTNHSSLENIVSVQSLSPSKAQKPTSSSSSSTSLSRKVPTQPVQHSNSRTMNENPQKPLGKSLAKPKVTPASTKTATKTATKTKSNSQVKEKEYWIQIGAYKDRYQADSIMKSLELQGFRGVLFIVNSDGQNIIRIRLGPYSDRGEAAKFLAWIKPLENCKESFITEVTSVKR